jgi:hypothetical protein
LQDSYLVVGEWPHLLADEGEDSNNDPIVDQRNGKARPRAAQIDVGDEKWNPVSVRFRRFEIKVVDEGAFLGVTAQQVSDRYRFVSHVFEELFGHVAAAATCSPARSPSTSQSAPPEASHSRTRPIHDLIEDRGEVIGRGIDDLQNLIGLLCQRFVTLDGTLGELALELRDGLLGIVRRVVWYPGHL